jgi:hydrogenase-4 component E
MGSALDLLLVVVLLLNFVALGSSRIRVVIRTVAAQGVLLGAMPLLARGDLGAASILLALPPIVLKGVVIPSMLLRAMRASEIKREVEPVVGLAPSLVLGALATTLAVAFSERLPLLESHAGGLVVPASLSTVLVGFLFLTTRLKAISQVLGYLVLENGIFIFGLLLAEAMPLLLEIGVLLDLVVAVFVMGIIIDHISREFSSIDTHHLSALRE